MDGEAGTFWTITTFFVILAIFIPILQAEAEVEVSYNNVDGLTVQDTTASVLATGGSIILTFLKLALWSFGSFPTWVDAIMLPVRATWWYLMVRLIRGGG